MFKAIFWDNDGVLVNTEPIFFAATKEILGTVGVELTHDFFIHEQLKYNLSTWELAKRNGISQEEIAFLRNKREELYAKLLQQNVPIVEGVTETLKLLSGKMRMGVVTSSRKDHFDIIMAKSKLREYFEFFITKEDVTNEKPDPEPYLLALSKTNLAPEECLVIEDTERGLIAAKKAGLTCYVIPNELSRELDFSLADKVLTSVQELPFILSK